MVTLTQPEYERTPAPSLFPTLLLTTVLNRGLISSWRPLVSKSKPSGRTHLADGHQHGSLSIGSRPSTGYVLVSRPCL
jgi:hypothetical protein